MKLKEDQKTITKINRRKKINKSEIFNTRLN